jgi:hypothetical protein
LEYSIIIKFRGDMENILPNVKMNLEDVIGLLKQLNIECSEKNVVIIFNSLDKLKGVVAAIELQLEKIQQAEPK